MLVSAKEDADESDKQVLYKVRVHSAQPELAYALLRKESAHLIIYMRGAPFHVGQVEMFSVRVAVSSACNSREIFKKHLSR